VPRLAVIRPDLFETNWRSRSYQQVHRRRVIGQSPEFLQLLMALAMEADVATREIRL